MIIDILSQMCQTLNMRSLVRTTLRLEENLKNTAQRIALEESTTLQDIFNRALKAYLEKENQKKAKKIVFKTHDLGEPLDNLTRANYYTKP